MEKDKLDFSTKDLVLATYLLYSGIKLSEGYDVGSKSWIFDDKKKCSDLALLLRNNETSVEVNKYESVRRNLLGMTHDGKRS